LTVTDDGTAARGKCAVAECRASVDGTCHRAKPSPLDCEEFELELAGEATEPPPPAEPLVSLPQGRALRPDELAPVLRRDRTARVVPLGVIEAGKTTLFCVLFEFVTCRRLDGWRYVESLSTLGFTWRGHEAAARSNRSEATTGRTSGTVGNELLHLRVRRVADDALRSVLLADVSGEHVEALTTEGRIEPFLSDAVAVADHILLLVDGEQAANPATRPNAVRHTIDIAQVLQELPVPEYATLAVVLTKVDYFPDDEGADTVLAEVAAAVTRCTGAGDVRTFAIAARPNSGARVEPGHGLAALFAHVAEKPRHAPTSVFVLSRADPAPTILRRIWGSR